MHKDRIAKLEKIIVSVATIFVALILAVSVMLAVKYTKHKAGKFTSKEFDDFKFYYTNILTI